LLRHEADSADCFQRTFISALEVTKRETVRNWPGLLRRLATAIENVKKAQSVSFSLTCKFGSQPPIESKFYIQSGYIRQEMPGKQSTFDAKVPFLIVAVADLHKGEIVQVDYTDKTAQKYPMNEKTKKQFVNPVESISQLAEDDAERIGEENVNGHKTIVYSLRRMQSWIGGGKVGEGESAKVWTDAHSGLPVRMVLEHSQEPNNKISLELTDFVWNSSMPPEIFKLDIPDGFKLSDKPPELGYPAK